MTFSDEQNDEIEAMAQSMIQVCEEKKAADIVLFHVDQESVLADYYLICCGLSLPHVRALADGIRRRMLDEGYQVRSQEGSAGSQWVILDYGVVLVHILTPEMRRHYTLEQLWDKRLIVYEGGEPLPEESETMEEFEEPNSGFRFEDEDEEEEGEFQDDDEDEEDEEFQDEGEDDEEFQDDEEEEDLVFEDEDDGAPAEEAAPAEESEEDRAFRAKLFGQASSAPNPKKSPTLDDLFGDKK